MKNSFPTFNRLFHALLVEKEKKKKRNVISFAQTIIHQNNLLFQFSYDAFKVVYFPP